jgi:hypothetical protein
LFVGRLSSTIDTFNLRARVLIGRSRVAGLRIEDASVSGEQAVLAWRDEGWQLRDLGSCNGTRVNGDRVEPGLQRCLRRGDTLSFGCVPDEWRLIDDSPPELIAKRMSDGCEVVARSGVLGLPSEQDPVGQVFPVGPERWIFGTGSWELPIVDGQIVNVGGESWQVSLPLSDEDTRRQQRSAGPLRQVTLAFRVSRDEETVLIALQGPGEPMQLDSRAHNYLLLQLARRRLQDIALPPSEQGWIDRAALAESLRVDLEHLNVQLFRIRRAFADAGFADAGSLVETRGRPSQLRIGVARLSVQSL